MSTGSPPHAVKLSAVSEDVPPKRYRIGELAQYTGLSRQTLHNYTRWGLISELAWTAGGHRVYGEESFARLRRIIELKRTCSMDEIRDQLQEIV
ncbi:MAG TPA: MerR family DNA-binding transcriptional regulator [Phycisphaerales bacterium]|nr:MerR family DNA-binding transcriptional regulator [Phycisphaerales bacterium]HCD31851.1 MerR family DNA-binding transcriptional regulator [Phycisphaerales bacterium]|tara:strand:+ start:1914 stop:2195 length:282 start_codon:yes stop_codon:yes gene_type:complete